MVRSKRITMKEVAKEAGVSLTTVSHYINKTRYVSDEIAQKIDNILIEKDYYKKSGKEGIRTRQVKTISVIVPDSSNPIFSVINREIEQLAEVKEYNVIVCNSNREYKNDIRHLGLLNSRGISGVILVSSREDSKEYNIINKYKIPTVLIERDVDVLNTDIVWGNHGSIMKDVVKHLADLGHKRIAYINREEYLFKSRMRFKGFLKGLEENNLKYYDDLVSNDGGFTFEDGYNEVSKFLYMDNKPTAFIVYTDVLAIGLMRAIMDKGYKIPEDFSIIGADNISVGDYIKPSLTTITFQKKEIAYNAFNLLIKRIEGKKNTPKKISVDLKLIVRESTGPSKK